MRELMVNFPERPDKLSPAIEQKVAARNSDYQGFRDIPAFVYNNMEIGWTYDHRAEITQQISRLTMDDLRAFHDKYIKGRPLVVQITGSAKRYDPKAVAKLLGADVKITEVKFDQLFKF